MSSDAFSLHPKVPRKPPFDSLQGLVEDVCPPFNPDPGKIDSGDARAESRSVLPLVLPAFFSDGVDEETPFIIDAHNLRRYLKRELGLWRYDRIRKYMCWASTSPVVQPLHVYANGFGSIVLTEQAEGHLVTEDDRLHIKPLPEYLLCYSTWESHLCKDEDLYASALGLLRSYFYLVRSKTDMIIAHQECLLPRDITWQQWTLFTRATLPHCDRNSCHPRYWYGELASDWLIWIERLYPETRSMEDLWYSWTNSYHTYSGHFQERTKWLLGALLYITVVLTAMQVGLATDRLKGDHAFQNASFGFTIFSILAPLAFLLIYLGMTLARVAYDGSLILQQERRNRNNSMR